MIVPSPDGRGASLVERHDCASPESMAPATTSAVAPRDSVSCPPDDPAGGTEPEEKDTRPCPPNAADP